MNPKTGKKIQLFLESQLMLPNIITIYLQQFCYGQRSRNVTLRITRIANSLMHFIIRYNIAIK